jgi:hypothetical protein
MDTITAPQLRALGGKVTILNVGRHQGSREISGAIRYRPDDLLNVDRLALPLPSDLPVVIYGAGNNELRTHAIAARLEEEGYAVSFLESGLDGWREIGGEDQEATLEQLVPPTNAREERELNRRA